MTYHAITAEWRQVCGFPISGMFTAFPCCKDPGHDGEHAFAAYHTSYRIVDGLTYELQGRSS